MLRLDERYSTVVGGLVAAGILLAGCTTRTVRCDPTHPPGAKPPGEGATPAARAVEDVRAAWLFARRQAGQRGAAALVEAARRELARQGWVTTGPEGAYVVARAPEKPPAGETAAGWGLWVVVDGAVSDATPFALGLELARRTRAAPGTGPGVVVVAVRGARIDPGEFTAPPPSLWVGLGPWKGPPRPPVAVLWGATAQRDAATALVRALLDRGVTALNGKGAQVPIEGVRAPERLDVLVAPAQGEDETTLQARTKLIEAITGALLATGVRRGDET